MKNIFVYNEESVMGFSICVQCKPWILRIVLLHILFKLTSNFSIVYIHSYTGLPF